ncbi:MAG: 50S ribosomal protein L11 methyltransferase [Clostridia bacterium]|nr:50S ribosomal protein L11 methyltransferase [Oscillospiraceae bacterium]MBQ7032487.1 50S ribosomal protein L11 methyltransferase [Clostridia bacterium]
MLNTEWIKVSIETTSAGIEPLYGMLLSMGIEGAEIEDEADFENFLENNTRYWDYVDDALREAKKGPTTVSVYLRDDENGRETLLLLRENLARLSGDPMLGTLAVTLCNIDENDWFEKWKQYYKPFTVGKNITVVPAWTEYEGKGTVLRINPGMLFGTGSHNTTRLCITLLEEIVKPGMTVFDVGCGSGILSILALLLGAEHATAVDIDAAAPRIAYENAALSGITKEKYTVLCGNVLEQEVTDEKFDVVVANIVADVIIPLSGKAGRYLKKGGKFLCSGIINDRVEEVLEALSENGFSVLSKQQDGEWWAILTEVK